MKIGPNHNLNKKLEKHIDPNIALVLKELNLYNKFCNELDNQFKNKPSDYRTFIPFDLNSFSWRNSLETENFWIRIIKQHDVFKTTLISTVVYLKDLL